MTPVRWAFEFAGLTSNRKNHWQTTVRVTKDMLLHYLGLDMVPLHEDPETGDIREHGLDYLPLTAFIRPEMFRDTMDKRIKLESQKQALSEQPSTSDEMGYDEMVANFENVAQFVDDVFEDAGADEALNQTRLEAAVKAGLLTVSDNPDKTPPPNPEPNRGSKRRVKLE